MSRWTKEELDQMLEDVVNVLDLSDGMLEKHGPLGTPPAILVKEVLEHKDREIRMLKQGFIPIENSALEIQSLRAQLEKAEKCMKLMRDRYVRLIDSGDAGNWEPREEKEVKDIDEYFSDKSKSAGKEGV